VTISRS